ncbi:Kelch repeat-containing protein [Dyadobacter sediminis]|uniref:T9SS type A sorting domain-containing protein n=1 Tax=Dyadobacter sediminis TaxID=1493691 RepID=A0A5R9KIV1_9BACT|nr:kelch repeat-containing protein [Dyadobacter sediminis]TLU96147.1 hypothetical protein FEM55_03110 [Dyadobacter sediminis]GGB79685.1 hypothetical protein GCM10011325_04030 [Dyadobacter sediminis]
MEHLYLSRFFSHSTSCFQKLSCKAFLLLFFIITTVHAQWIRKADELNKRAEGNNVIYLNKFYVFGGFSDNPVIENKNEVYDLATNKWKALAPFPAGKEITHQGVVLVDDNVWHIGGRSVDAHGPVSSQVVIYNITTDTWSNGPELIDPATGEKFPIGGGGYGLIGRTIHVFGGFGPTICEDQSRLHLTLDVDKYLADPVNTTWENKSAPMPIPRNHLSYVVLGGKIYALGGQFKHDCLAVDQKYCHVYDPVTNTWKRLSDIPVQRSHAEASTFAIDGKIFLVAGQGASNHTQNTTYQFSPQSNNGAGSWTSLSAYQLPGSFLGLSSKVAGSSFIITNGARDNYANERKETYSIQVKRSDARTLGFSVPCTSLTRASGTSSVFRNLLYCLEDTSPYLVTSNVGWLKITKNASGNVNLNGTNVEVSISTLGLAAGNYTGTIKATVLSTGSTATFCVNLQVTSGSSGSLITDIHTSSSGNYEQSILKVNGLYYSDRTYVITSAPEFLLNAPFIKTPNNDKKNTGSTVLTFSLTQSATVYAAYDPRATSLPEWLQDWKPETQKLGTNEPGISTLSLYSKDYPAGSVTIGGNLQSPATGSASNYIIIVKPKDAASSLRTTGLHSFWPESGSEKIPAEKQAGMKPLLFPNPATDHIRIEFTDKRKQISEIQLMEPNGSIQSISKSNIRFSEQGCKIQLSGLDLSPGIHFIVMHLTNGETEIARILMR